MSDIEGHDSKLNALKPFCQAMGLHPLVGFGMFAVDWMLFFGEVATVGVSIAITIPVAVVLSIACVFIQKYSFKDEWGAAFGKSLLIGLLTAIPSPLPSIVAFVGGAVGTVKVLLPNKQ